MQANLQMAKDRLDVLGSLRSVVQTFFIIAMYFIQIPNPIIVKNRNVKPAGRAIVIVLYKCIVLNENTRHIVSAVTQL